MNNIAVILRRIFYRRGDIIAAVIVMAVLCASVSSLARKEYMECMNRGLYTDQCVYFSANISGSVSFWDIADKEKIASVSYISDDIQDALYQYIKNISYGSRVRLPVRSSVFEKFTAEEWNAASGVGFVGRRLKLDETDGILYYYSYEPSMDVRVVGEMGIAQTTLTDLFIYIPFNGIIRSGKTYIAEGDKLNEVLKGLYEVSEHISDRGIGSLEVGLVGLPEEDRVQSPLIASVLFLVSLVVYLYVIYFWLTATKKQTEVLLLFGISKTKIWLHKWTPAALCSFMLFFVWLAAFEAASGLAGEFIKYWGAGFICLLLVNVLNCVFSLASVFGIGDIS